MEKYVPSYKLAVIKQVFSTTRKLRMTVTALRDARKIGFSMHDVVEALQQLKNTDFVKSMTTYSDHRVWQDVYYAKYNGYLLYIKFQVDELGCFVISFKEKS